MTNFPAAAAEWRESFKQFPKTRIADMVGLEEARAHRILAGLEAPSRAEAQSFDAALGCDACRLLSVAAGPVPTVPKAPTVPLAAAITVVRTKRVLAWQERVERSGLSLVAIAAAAGMPSGRTRRILREGAKPFAHETASLERVLGSP